MDVHLEGAPVRRLGARRLLVAVVLAALTAASATACLTEEEIDAQVHINQIQTMGTHNSYHEVSSVPERTLRRSILGQALEDEFTYTHRPLDVQFQSEFIRQIELDVFNDTAGGLYGNPLIRQVTGGGAYDPVMAQPGLKVLHAQDVDYHSNCLTFVACLTTVKQWSDANPSHVPIAILVELKDDIIDIGSFTFVHPQPFDVASMDRLDAEIRSVFGPDELITPDDVRGSRPTLEQAVLQDGWPTLGESRGKVLFLMDNAGSYRTRYLTGHPSLQGRVLFTNANPGDPDAAFVERNDAKGSKTQIQALVRAGYVVRTRADSPGGEVATGDTSTLEAALASGAQWVSTDYPVPGYSSYFGTDYVARLPEGVVARCNPVNGVPGCYPLGIEGIHTPADPPPAIPALPPLP